MLKVSPKLLKHIAVLAVFAAASLMTSAWAQESPSSGTPTGSPPSNPGPTPSSGSPATGSETGTMEHYLNNHPKVADELHNDPSLINNPQWLSQHPVVQNWMNKHPNVKEDAATNPKEFVNHTEHETLNTDRHALNSTDDYLSKHPALAKQLNENPKLVDDPKFLADHPSLNNYLKEHPGTADEWKSHPNTFADAARANERYNKTGQVPKPMRK
jgi:hypothetical protein